MIAALARLPVARWTRAPRAWTIAGAWACLAFAVAIAAHARGAAHGADHVLVEGFGGLILPLLAYMLVGAALPSGSLASSCAPLVAFGAAPSRAAAVAIAVAAAECAAAGAIIAAGAAILAHGPADPSRARDAVASAYAGALGGAAYGSWFSLGATFGRRGGGRALLLFADWALGAGTGAGGLFSPRAHLRNLLGGAPPVDLTERASACALVVLAVVCALAAARRCRA